MAPHPYTVMFHLGLGLGVEEGLQSPAHTFSRQPLKVKAIPCQTPAPTLVNCQTRDVIDLMTLMMGVTCTRSKGPSIRRITSTDTDASTHTKGPSLHLHDNMYYHDMVDRLTAIHAEQQWTDATLDNVALTVLAAYRSLERTLHTVGLNGMLYLVKDGLAGTSRLFPLMGAGQRHLFVKGGDVDPIKCGEQRVHRVDATRHHLQAAKPTRSQLWTQWGVTSARTGTGTGTASPSTAKAKYVVMVVSKHQRYHALGLSRDDVETLFGMKECYFSHDRKIIDDGW